MKHVLGIIGVVVVVGLTHGAVMDLVNLVHRYEDEILGRKVGLPGIRSQNDVEEENEQNNVGRPIEVHGWDDNLKLGQVSAVDVNLDDDPVIFQRGPVSWNAKSFDLKNVLREKKLIEEDTILTIDADKGKVKSGFGSGLFYMPHGLKIDHEGNTWVTDVGMHQVMKFNKGDTKPSLVLGEKFVPGNDANHFCKPTSVAVASTGQIFVADGYCNNRVAVYDPKGKHIHDIQGNWNVVHSVVLFEQEDIVCIANREGKSIECLGAGLHSPQFLGQSSSTIKDLGRVYAITGRGAALLAVNGKGSYYDPPTRGVTLDLESENQLVDTWGDELVNPHDVAVARAGDAVYVVEIGPNAVRKFEVVTPAAEMF